MIRDIFVPLLRADSDETALDVAVALASSQEAHVAALVTFEFPMPLVTEFGYVPTEFNQQQLDEARAEAERRAGQARARLARAAVSSEVRISKPLVLWSEETAALHALHSDISILGRPAEAGGSPRFPLTFRSLLLRSGRPVLVVPQGASLPMPLRRVVVAWKPTPEATRALHDALPLLTPGVEIDLVVVDPRVSEAGHGEQPGADISRHLARHGLRLNLVSLPREGLSTGDCLLRHVRSVDADLLVLGGYGHSHWTELVLGGTTRDVLEGASTPVLFSH